MREAQRGQCANNYADPCRRKHLAAVSFMLPARLARGPCGFLRQRKLRDWCCHVVSMVAGGQLALPNVPTRPASGIGRSSLKGTGGRGPRGYWTGGRGVPVSGDPRNMPGPKTSFNLCVTLGRPTPWGSGHVLSTVVGNRQTEACLDASARRSVPGEQPEPVRLPHSGGEQIGFLIAANAVLRQPRGNRRGFKKGGPGRLRQGENARG